MPILYGFQAASIALREKLTDPSGPTQGRFTFVINFTTGGSTG